MRFTFDGLWKHTDFRHLWAAESISQIGGQIAGIALPLIAALTLDASAFEVGALAAASQAPLLLIGLFAGAWIDRRHRRPVMVAADVLRALILLAIPLGVAFDMLTIHLLFVIAFTSGTLTVVFDIAYVAYVPALVGDDDLVEANSKLQASASVAQVSGPGLGGLLIGVLTAPYAMAINAATFLASAFFLAKIRSDEPAPTIKEDARVLTEIKDGLAYVAKHQVLRALAGCASILSFFGAMFMAIYVLYMVEDLELGSTTIGIIFALGGVGAFIGAVVAEPMSRRFGMGWTLIVSQFMFGAFGAFIPVAVLVPSIALPMIILSEFSQWFWLVIYFVAAVSARQLLTEPEMRGRTTASFNIIARGLQPVGALLGGWLGGTLGLPLTLVIATAGLFGSFTWLLTTPKLRDHDLGREAAVEPAPAPA
jgi:MFS family permease